MVSTFQKIANQKNDNQDDEVSLGADSHQKNDDSESDSEMSNSDDVWIFHPSICSSSICRFRYCYQPTIPFVFGRYERYKHR
ncbi:hypothetical protein ACS0TY_017608 [Phlomoides rotata]